MLEKKYVFLTIIRCVMIFFMIVFTVPLFIRTSYKPFASEFLPYKNMFESMKEQNETIEIEIMKKFFDLNSATDRYNPIFYFKAPNIELGEENPSDIRNLAMIVSRLDDDYIINFNYTRQLELYSFLGIMG